MKSHVFYIDSPYFIFSFPFHPLRVAPVYRWCTTYKTFHFIFVSFVVVFRPVLSHFSLSLLCALLCFFLVVVVDMQSSSVSFFFPPLSFSHHRIWWWHDAGITSGCCLFLFFPFFQLIERQHASIFLFFLDIISCLFYMRHQLFQMSVHTHTYFSCIGTT
jgi:hypothetical protein